MTVHFVVTKVTSYAPLRQRSKSFDVEAVDFQTAYQQVEAEYGRGVINCAWPVWTPEKRQCKSL